MVAREVAVAGAGVAHRPEALEGIAGWAVETHSYESASEGPATADSPGASAAAWEGTVAHIPGVGTHLAAAVAEGRVHIARYCMPVAASSGCAVDPCWY